MTQEFLEREILNKNGQSIFLKKAFNDKKGRYYVVGGSFLESVHFSGHEHEGAEVLFQRYEQFFNRQNVVQR